MVVLLLQQCSPSNGGKDKHHLSNNFSHPDYIPESLLLCTIHRLQLLLIPGVVLLKLVMCVSFKSSWQEDHVARINLSIFSAPFGASDFC